jgi:D-glycero-alpha-D-manno-heptose 1-phosphate guanylyltransferase
MLLKNQRNDGGPKTADGLGGEAIILAGGLGTRLRDAVPDLPKCMAPVAGRPFLFYVINYLRLQGIEKFIFSLGYKYEIIEEYLAKQFSTLQYQIVLEEEPMGTGGAIKLACEKAMGGKVLVVNGDTLFKINVEELNRFHQQTAAECTLALKPMQNFDRYGVVEIKEDRSVSHFKEKQFYTSGNINGGVYVLNVSSFLAYQWPQKFSFEKDYLEKKPGKLFAIAQDEYFIDIGIPEDYNRAQKELQKAPLDLTSINKDWTLFLDRDGVINEDKDGSYIFSTDEFIFTKGAPALFKKLTEKFKHIIIITNQRGVGRELMTEDTLSATGK